jgi:hypothetical protein
MERLVTDYEGQEVSVIEAVQKSYAAQGWEFLEFFGVATPDAIPAALFFSDTAPTITATAFTDGIETKKAYSQNRLSYLTVTMQRPTSPHGEDGDRFDLVFTRPKP